MYAIVEIAGQQFKVVKDQKVFVHRLQTEEGKQVAFDNVLLIGEGGKVTIGAPAISGAQVGAKVLKHLKGDKVIVFKKKRRKGFRKKNGHRQSLTEIIIESIVASGAKKSETAATPKKEAAPKVEKAVAPKTEKVAATKTATAKAAPKATAKKDDLKKIEGIGPVIEKALKAAGIVSFEDLAKAKPAKVNELIADIAGHHVADTWPAQAKLAAAGKWDELLKWQDELKGGIAK